MVPGARLENYHISRLTNVLTTDDEEEECPAALGGPDEECVFFEGYTDDPFKESYTRTHFLPGAAFAYGLGAKQDPVDYGSKSLGNSTVKTTHTSTVYGGYHRGLTMNVLREVAFPVGDELGNNYQIGVRSTAIRGVTFDVAGSSRARLPRHRPHHHGRRQVQVVKGARNVPSTSRRWNAPDIPSPGTLTYPD